MLAFTANPRIQEIARSHSGSYTTSDLSRKSGDIIAEALRWPVTITQRNKSHLSSSTLTTMSA